VSIIVSMWLLLAGGVGDEVLRGGRPRWLVLALGLTVNVLAALAVWVELARPPRPRRLPRRYRRMYD
jgi:hypothetical protein